MFVAYIIMRIEFYSVNILFKCRQIRPKHTHESWLLFECEIFLKNTAIPVI